MVFGPSSARLLQTIKKNIYAWKLLLRSHQADLHIFYPLTYFSELYNPDASQADIEK